MDSTLPRSFVARLRFSTSGRGGMILVGVVAGSAALALLYIDPARKLGGFSSRIADLMKVPSEANLVTALNEQRAFWKYVGIMMVVMLALYAILILVMLVTVGFAAAASAAGGS